MNYGRQSGTVFDKIIIFILTPPPKQHHHLSSSFLLPPPPQVLDDVICEQPLILGEKYSDYLSALQLTGCVLLEDRRIRICEKFARKASKHEKYKTWFCFDSSKTSSVKTRAKSKVVVPKYLKAKTRTERYKKSPLPYLTEALN